MALGDTAKLLASLDLDNRKFNAGVDKSMGKLGQLGVKGVAIGSALGVGLERLAEAGIRKLSGAITGGINSLADLEDATISVDGAIAQVGKGWTTTGAQVAAVANDIEASVQAAFDDKAITQAATTLIRYGNISEQNLRPAMEVMTDLAARTGSVESASDALAKALADPTKATRLLRTAGVALTKDQQKQIKAWVEAGDLEKAQAFLLKEVAKQTKGAAAAMHGPFRDSQLVLADVVEDAQRALGEGLLPVIMEVRDELSKELAKKETLQRIRDFGKGLADGFRSAVTFVKQIPWDQVGAVLKGALDFGKGLANAFMGLPTEAKGLILGLAALDRLSGGAVINVGVDLLKGAGGTLFQQFLGRGSVANPMVVIPVGGGLGGPGGPGVVAGGGGILGLLGAASVAAAILSIAVPIGQGLRQGLGITFGSQSQEAHGRVAGMTKEVDRVQRTKPVAMSPDERQEFNDQKRALERIKGASEATRTSLGTAIRSGDSAIVRALYATRPMVAVKVSVIGNTVRTTYDTGTTIGRNVNPNYLKAGLT